MANLTDQQIAAKNARADANNLNYAGLQGSTIASNQLQPTTPINVSGLPTDNTPPNIEGDMAYFQGIQNKISTEEQALQNQKATANTGIESILRDLGGQGQEQLNLEQQYVNPLQTQIADITGQANVMTADYNKAIQEYDKLKSDAEVTAGKTGQTWNMFLGTSGAIDRAKASELNVKASNIALLQAQSLALQGKADLAQKQVDRAIDLKYKAKEQELAIKQFQLEQINEGLTAEQTKRKEAQQYALKKEEERTAEAKALEKYKTEMITTALSAGAPQSVIDTASKAKTTLEAAQILGKYSPETLKYELLKEQVKTEKAQQSKIYADIQKTKTETSQLGQPGSGKPATEGQITNAGYADRIQQANSIIDAKTPVLQNLNYAQFKLLESKSQLSNKLLSPDQRQAAQAMRNFITAKLRKESGAAISPTEFDDARLQYFPALGDDTQTITNKKALRDSVLNNLISGSGGAYTPTAVSTIPNKFQQATGNVNQVIPGTGSVSGFNKDGTINFKLQ